MNKEKARISSMFSTIVPRYDLVNRLLSLGFDGGWRRQLVRSLNLSQGDKILDVCAGTGDVALEVVQQIPHTSVVAVDFSAKMLEKAEQKIQKKKLQKQIECMEADATALPFASNSFDGVAMAFGLRNVEDSKKGISEMLRVLKPGKRVGILEFSKPKNSLLRFGSRIYMKVVAPLLGTILSKGSAYRYLTASVEDFIDNIDVVENMKQGGFVEVTQVPLFFGTVSLYLGKKP